MSVERYTDEADWRNDTGVKRVYRPDGDSVRFTDYERDCIKGRCGWCAKYNKDYGNCAPLGLPKQPDGYCDEWEARFEQQSAICECAICILSRKYQKDETK